MTSTAVATAQEQAPIPVADYWQQIETTQTVVNDLKNAPLETQRTALRAQADQLDTITAVVLEDGRVIPVQPAYLIHLLRAEEPDLTQLNAQLSSLQSAQTDWPEAQLDTPDADTLSAILSRPEFQYEEPEPNALQRFLQNLRRRIFDFLADLLPEGSTAASFGNIITFLGIMALAAILIYAFRELFTDLISESAITPDDRTDGELLTADIALKRAQTLSTDGDYRAAVRYLYLSSLLLLEERDLLRYDRTMTNREYLRSVSHHPRLEAILQDVIGVFDRVWYGLQPLDATEYDKYAQQVEQLKKQREER